jgi:Fe2+ transport system protein B
LTGSAIITALIFGLVAKESAVSVLLLYPDALSNLTLPIKVALATFYLLYPVCINATVAMKNWRIFFLNLIIAFITSFAVYFAVEIIIRL